MVTRFTSWRLGLAAGLVIAAHTGTQAQAGPEPPYADGPVAETQDANTVQQLKDELGRIGNLLSKTTDPAQVAAYNLRQAVVIGHIINQSAPAEQAAWVRQMAECLGVAATSSPPGDRGAYDRLLHLERQLEAQRPGSDLAAYVTWLEMQIDNAARQNAAGDDLTKAQEERRLRLTQFVEAYPKASDTSAALLELGMLGEFQGKEEDAKHWYEQAVERCGGTQPAFKAQGALRRLDLQGKFLFLDLPLLEQAPDQNHQVADISQLRGKLVVVYFWASWDPRCQRDFHTLSMLLEHYRDQGLELLSVNVDKNPEEARTFLRSQSIPGVHTYQKDGLDGTVTTRYGIMALPMTFVVAQSGKVVQRNAEVASIESLIKQQLK